MAKTVPFTRGAPSASLLPVEDLRLAAADALARDAAGALSYAPGGYAPLRRWIAERHGVAPERVLLLNGSLQGVAFVVQHLFGARGERAGRAIVELPTYDRTLTTLRAYGADVEAVPVEADGVDLDALERAVAAGPPPALVYLIPTFQNPSGVALSAAKRRRLAEFVREHDLLVMEDDPYGLLRFEGEPAPSLLELDGGDRVIYSSSFTKTVAPGLRTGYLVLPERLVAPFGALAANTYIAPNAFAEATLAAYCAAGRFEPNVARATALLRERRDAMAEGLERAFPAEARWQAPAGGYFFWVELPPELDAAALLPEATAAGAPYVAGADFCVAGGRSSLRLAFSAAEPDEIAAGIELLGTVVSRALERGAAAPV
jgi:2-aminoadipate transaminase